MSAIVLRGDARNLPLPYWSLRDYRDGGQSVACQIGNEPTWREYLANLQDCTREWMRVLRPSGSIFVNLADKYASGGRGTYDRNGKGINSKAGDGQRGGAVRPRDGAMPKSLLGLPWRYALACTDDLGLILRRDIIWAKPNGMPESVTDRCRSSHEYMFHLVKQPRYYAAVDEIREPHETGDRKGTRSSYAPGSASTILNGNHQSKSDAGLPLNPLGKLPGSVWEIASQPLTVPPALGVDHFAAFPMELPRRIILGWSPAGICMECGEGRYPVSRVASTADRKGRKQRIVDFALDAAHGPDGRGGERWKQSVTITGYACTCTPYTDHPERRGKDFHAGTDPAHGMNDGNGGERFRRYQEELASPRGPVREYDFATWAPAPARPAVVLDPFGGTGTTALVASMLGRHGISVDRSADYCRLARWRTTDPGERARALGVPKPPPVPEAQGSLFDDLEAS